MFLFLEVEQQFVVDEILDHRAFVGALSLILEPKDIVVFGTYGSRRDVNRFLWDHQIKPDEFISGARRTFKFWKREYPNGTAFGLKANPTVLARLVELLGPTSTPTDLCDHIVAYNSQFPILSFHDAFKSDPCHISSRVPVAKVEAFCAALGKPYALESVPEW
ncbi:MAG TPA: hypothetical protein VIK52_09800 [Opitutaceae bacterium]